jgi:hypothetical protein
MNSAVIAPITSTKFSAVSDSSNSGDMRATMKMPAVTIVAAWISAEIGVGPSIESGSHTCSGNCADLPIAPMNRQMQVTVISDHSPPRELVSLARRRRLAKASRSRASRRRRDEADAQDEAEVADAVDQEGLHVGEDRRRASVPEADQQVGHQAHRFPAEEQLQEVVAHHQHQHREGEQRDVAEEALVARVLGHVADGVDVHHQRHEGHHAHHHRGQAVDQEADLHLQIRRAPSIVDGAVEARAGQRVLQHVTEQQEGDQHAEDGDDVGAGRPISLPNRPARMAPTSGASGMASRRFDCDRGVHGQTFGLSPSARVRRR